MFHVLSTLLNSIAGFLLHMRKRGTERLYNMTTFTGLNFRCSGSKSNVLPLYAHHCSDPKLPAHHGGGSCNLHYFTTSHPNPIAFLINAIEGQKYRSRGQVWGNGEKKVQDKTPLTFSESVQTWMALGMRRAVFSLVMEQMSFKRTVSWHSHRDRDWITSKKRH